MIENEVHPNGRAAKDPSGTHSPIWMVVRDGYEGRGYATFGPMSKAEAKEMTSGFYGGHVVCATCERQSPTSNVGHVL